MDENNPEEPSIKVENINPFYNFESCENVFELNDKEADFSLKLSSTEVAENISGPSTSQQPIYIKNKNPIQKAKNGKAKILSVVHIPSPILNNKGNKHIPIILKKSSNLKLKVKNPMALSNLAASMTQISQSSIQYINPVAVNSAQKDALNIYKQLNEPADSQETPTDNQLPNSGEIQSENLSQMIPFSNQSTSLINNTEIQFANICAMPQNLVFADNFVEALSTSKVLGNEYVPNDGQIAEIFPKESDSGIISSNESGISILQDDATLNSVQQIHQLPKLVKMQRMVSILKSNQPSINSLSPIINLQRTTSEITNITTLTINGVENTATELQTETTFVSETSEPGVSFLGETSQSAVNILGETPEAVVNILGETPESGVNISGETPESEVSFLEETPESGVSILKQALLSEKLTTSCKINESLQDSFESFVTVSSLSENDVTKNLEPECEATFGIRADSFAETEPKIISPEVFGIETVPPIVDDRDYEMEATLKNESNLQVDTTLLENQVYLNETALFDEQEEEAMQMELDMEMNMNNTVASDEIPYNAEVVIDNEANKSSEVNLLNVTPINNCNNMKKQINSTKKMIINNLDSNNNNGNGDGDGELEFNLLKETSKRTLFLEKEDMEFCKAAQRKVKKGIDESPATVHALMVACKNNTGPVLDHLRYIQKSRQILKENSTSSAQSTDSSSSLLSSPVNDAMGPQQKINPLIAKRQLKVYTPCTRKKKISYNVDLSDNYADDSDEDYVPGQDLIPKKKKRSKRRYCLGKKKMLRYEWSIPKVSAEPTTAATAASAAVNTQLNNTYEQAASATTATATTLTATATTTLGNLTNHYPELYPLDHSSESDDEKRVIRYNKMAVHRKRRNGVGADGEFSALPQNKVIYKAEPLQKENLELIKFKKKRTPNSFIVPPIQKYMYTHEDIDNFRYMTITKQQ